MRSAKLTVTATTIVLICLVMASAGLVEAQPLPADEPQPDGAFGATNPSHRVSDSPWLQLPEELRDAPPALPSGPQDGGEAAEGEPPTMVMYDFATGRESRIPSDHPGYVSMEPYQASSPAFSGLLPAGMTGLESVLPPDGRTQVSPTTTYPWRTVVKLYGYFTDGAVLGCSGSIIGCADGHGYHVLTAGHCVYSHEHGGWATSVRAIPGLDGTYMPYNYAWATGARTYSGWTVSADTRDDWAVLTLDRNVGDHTGWMGRLTCNPPGSCSEYTTTLNTAGYPADKGGDTMWHDANSGHSVDEYNHWYYLDTYGGQSGSPVWLYYSSSDSRYILTVHTCGTGGCGIDGKGVNHGTRLNENKYNAINDFCSADTPPTDRADLIDDGQAFSGFSPTAVRPGGTSFHVWSDVRNVGTAASGGFYVSYYASANTTISTSDYLIVHDAVSSISPFNYGNSDWISTFPSGVPDGLYYVGWLIDGLGQVTEFDEGNNTAYKTTYRVLVDGTPPSNPSVSSSSHIVGAWSDDNTISVNWSGASDGSGSGVSGYSYAWSTSASTLPDTSVDTTGSSATSPALGNSSNWYFHIRTQDNVGNWNSGAAHLGPFRIDTSSPSNPTSATETHGAENNVWQNTVADPAFTWSGASDVGGSGIAGYYLYWGTSSSGTSGTWTNISGYNPGPVSSPGVYYLRVQTRDNAGNTSAWTTLFTFRYDASPPSNPTSVSETHGAPDDTWQNTVQDPAFTWSGASDGGGSGVAGYYLYWGTSASGTSGTWTNISGYNPGPVSSPSVHYLRVQTRDNAGNTSGWTTLFTFRYDASPPSNPSSVSSPSHTVDTWSNDNTIAVSWSGASDGSGSGLYGYSYEWSTSSTTIPDDTADTTGNSATSPALSDGDNWYFHIRTRDNVGNWNSGAVHLGPYPLDTSAPTCAVDPLPASQKAISFVVTWSGDDAPPSSGLDSYDLQYRVGSGGIWSDWELDTVATARTFGPSEPVPLENGQTYYFRCRARDTAGNLGGYATGDGDTWTTIYKETVYLPFITR